MPKNACYRRVPAQTIAAGLAVALVLVMLACTTVAPDERPATGVEPRAMPKPAGGPVESRPVPRAGVVGEKAPPLGALKDPSRIPSKRSVYFDYDQFDIKEQYRPIIQAHAKHLRENDQARTLIQGHADERGSREYNIALGQRRAESVKQMLTLLGASEKQLEAVSLGEEKPVCTENNEGCWWRNRRADVLYPGEY